MKKETIIFCFSLMITSYLAPKKIFQNILNAINSCKIISTLYYDKVDDEEVEKTEESIEETLKEKYESLMAEYEVTTDKYTWFIEYKEFLNESIGTLDPPETIYDVYSIDEINIFQRIVEAEVTDGDFISKVNVANVILNRVNDDGFPNTIEGVVFQKNQFSPIKDGRYYTVEPTEDTLLAIEYAFMFEDTTGGALFFESGNRYVHAKYAEYLFKDDAGHHFYK